MLFEMESHEDVGYEDSHVSTHCHSVLLLEEFIFEGEVIILEDPGCKVRNEEW